MRKIILIPMLLMLVYRVSAQQVNVNGHFYGEDAFKFSSYTNFGSTRTIGMGGAFTALGGDAASTAINPAGLGFYNRSEFSISPVFRNVSTTSTYLDRSVSRNSDYSSIGQLGAVFNRGSSANAKRKSTFGIGFHTLANFNREYTLQGSNNRSSLMDYFAEQATFRGAHPSQLDSEFDVNLGLAETPTAMYYQAYLIDPFEDQYIVAEPSFPVNQSINVSERGSLGQFSLAYAINYSDKTYFGAALGVQTLNYNVMNYHQEDFPNGEVFNSFAYDDQLLVKGTGVNINTGIIHKVTEYFRVGANFSSPTWMGVRETFYSGVEIDQKPNTFETEFSRIETIPGDFNYRMTSPVRLSLGAAYMLPGKIGVISADAEYVGYSNMGVKDKSNLIDDAEQNAAIASVYKDVINFKGGAELRFGKARIRGGVNYLADPMKQDNGLDRSNLILSAGAGFRGARFFADAAYTRTQFNTSYTPYTLSDPQNYASGAVENRAGVLSFTVGTFF